MSDATLPFDPEEMDHLEARQAIRGLPADADFEAILERERVREHGPRPAVVKVLEDRIGGAPAHVSGTPSPTETPPSNAAAVGDLDEPEWTEHDWRGHRLFKCKHCPTQEFEPGRMYEHVQKHHLTKTKE